MQIQYDYPGGRSISSITYTRDMNADHDVVVIRFTDGKELRIISRPPKHRCCREEHDRTYLDFDVS